MDHAIRNHAPPFQFSIWTLALITFNVAFLFAVGRIPEVAFGAGATMLKAYVVLLTVYGWRFSLVRSELPNRQRWIGLLTIFLLCLPFIWVCMDPMFPNSRGLPPSKWLGLPIWLFAIPFASFLLFDINTKVCSLKKYLWRSAVEIIVLFHVWMYIWAFLQWCLGWGQF